MFRAAFVAALCGVLLPSCQSWCARSVPEDTPVMLSMLRAEYHLQLLPHGEGVRVQRSTPAAAFVLKDNAYMVESDLRALMRKGYTREDRPLSDSERDLTEDVKDCNKEGFERHAHQMQDFFAHYGQGYRAEHYHLSRSKTIYNIVAIVNPLNSTYVKSVLWHEI